MVQQACIKGFNRNTWWDAVIICFFKKINFHWSIVALQCVNFYCTVK